ncbi:MAG: hypothetical protein KKH99_08010, partial [Proteobacteria bacterium]|nr:hypothetical protein [Pseudomonadota bacterium]
MYRLIFKLFPLLKPTSLKTKFIYSVLPPITVCFLGISIIAAILSYDDMEKNILNRYQANVHAYIKPLILPLWNVNDAAIQSQVQAILNYPDITGVKLIEKVTATGNEKIFTAGLIPEDETLSDHLMFSQDIIY